MELKQARQEIDNLDNAILNLVAKRMELAKEIAEIKKKHNLPLEDRKREEELVQSRNKKMEELGFDDRAFVKQLFTIINRYPRNDNKEWIEKEPYSGYRSYDFAFIYKRPELGIELEGELQVRTILQHAWAEVSHDTFYKNDWLFSAAEEYRECLMQDMHALSDMLSAVDRQFVQLRKLALMKCD